MWNLLLFDFFQKRIYLCLEHIVCLADIMESAGIHDQLFFFFIKVLSIQAKKVIRTGCRFFQMLPQSLMFRHGLLRQQFFPVFVQQLITVLIRLAFKYGKRLIQSFQQALSAFFLQNRYWRFCIIFHTAPPVHSGL